MSRHLLHIPFLLLLTSLALGQSYPDSPVFRDYRPPSDRNKKSSAYRQQVDIFLLERDASNGDPIAQHELGVRYLSGRGVQADTAKSGDWLRRSAEQGFAPALYNYALLLANGWSVKWDPYAAFDLFLLAARQGMPEAQFVVGVFHTDDLVLPRNWDEAHRWMSMAAEQGNERARLGMEEIERRGHVPISGTTAPADAVDKRTMDPSTPRSEEDVDVRDAVSAAAQPGVSSGSEARVPATGTPRSEDEWTPLLLDFDQDSTRTNLSTARLAHDIIEAMSFSSTDSVRMVSLANPGLVDTSALAILRRLVRACSPEALLLSGRMHEEGLHVPSSAAIAAKYYIRASWNESPLALPALGRLLGTARNADLLLQAAWAGDADAQFASAAIRALEIDNRLTPRQAHDMLRRAIQAGSSDALVQLGLWYAGGRIVERDMPKALEAWRMAASMGSEEGRLRLSAAAVFDEEGALPLTTALPVLEASSRDGSLLAAVALARSYELGVGRTANKGIAAHMYRDAAVRGSRSAYAALRRMYDEIRP